MANQIICKHGVGLAKSELSAQLGECRASSNAKVLHIVVICMQCNTPSSMTTHLLVQLLLHNGFLSLLHDVAQD